MAMGPMGGRGMRPAEKSKRGLRGVQRELFSYSERIKLPMLIALVLAAAGAVLTILGPNQLSKITNLISDSLMGEIDLAAIGRVAGVLLGIYALSALLTYIEHYIMATVTLGLSKQMRRDLCAKINRVPMSYFNRIAHGDILSRVTNDVSTLQQALSNSLPSMISAVAQLTGCVIMMFVTEWRMALAAIAATMIGFVFMFIFMMRSQKYFVDRQESLGTLHQIGKRLIKIGILFLERLGRHGKPLVRLHAGVFSTVFTGYHPFRASQGSQHLAHSPSRGESARNAERALRVFGISIVKCAERKIDRKHQK